MLNALKYCSGFTQRCVKLNSVKCHQQYSNVLRIKSNIALLYKIKTR